MVAGHINDVSHKNGHADEASNHVIVIPLDNGIPYNTFTLLRGDIFIVDGVNGIWLEDEKRVRKN